MLSNLNTGTSIGNMQCFFLDVGVYASNIGAHLNTALVFRASGSIFNELLA